MCLRRHVWVLFRYVNSINTFGVYPSAPCGDEAFQVLLQLPCRGNGSMARFFLNPLTSFVGTTIARDIW
jgi:hypothetical protein